MYEVGIMKKRNLLIAAVLSGIVLGAGAVAPAYAADDAPEDDVKMYFRVDGQVIPVDDAYLAEHTLNLEAPAEPEEGTVAPYLIDFNQWVDCFSLNNENGVFAEYRNIEDGHDIRLKCGNDSWGYKHIRLGKEADWQAKLNGARAAGWVSETQGIESWDDLMASVAGISITWPDYDRENTLAQTKCGVSEAIFRSTETGEIVYSFYARAAWATNNDRLLTAFPQSGSTC